MEEGDLIPLPPAQPAAIPLVEEVVAVWRVHKEPDPRAPPRYPAGRYRFDAPAGEYPVTCSVGSLSAPGYVFDSFVAGTLTVSYSRMDANSSEVIRSAYVEELAECAAHTAAADCLIPMRELTTEKFID